MNKTESKKKKRVRRSYYQSPRYSRLNGTLTSYQMALQGRLHGIDRTKETWPEEVENLLDQTRIFLENNQVDEAWKCFHTAQRIEVHGMSKQERHNQAKALKHEVSKLNVWRKKAIDDLIGDPNSDTYEVPDADSLIYAIELKDEHYNNQYYQNRLTRSLYSLLFILMSVNSVFIILYFWFIYASEGMSWLQNLTGIILFGFLGAIVSSILFTRSQAEQSRITEINSNRFIVLSKIAVGVGFTVFIYFLLKSSFVSKIELFSFEVSSAVDYFTIAFVSGFTERLAQRAINLIVGGEEKKEEKK